MSCSKKCFAVSVPDQIPEHSNPVSGGKGNSPIILAYHPDQAGQGKDDYFWFGISNCGKNSGIIKFELNESWPFTSSKFNDFFSLHSFGSFLFTRVCPTWSWTFCNNNKNKSSPIWSHCLYPGFRACTKLSILGLFFVTFSVFSSNNLFLQQQMWKFGRGDGLAVSVFAFHSDNTSSNPLMK